MARLPAGTMEIHYFATPPEVLRFWRSLPETTEREAHKSLWQFEEVQLICMLRFCTTDFTERVAGVCTNPCQVTPSICWPWVWKVLMVMLLAPGILRWLAYFFGKSMYMWLTLQTVLNKSESAFRPLACIREVSGSKIIRAPAVPRFSMVFLSVSIRKSES
jgi:hypothetical protein